MPELRNAYDAVVNNGYFEDWAIEVHEWLGLVSLQSPRIREDDEIDPYLSRYSVPDLESAEPANLVTLRWSGFIPSHWIKGLFIELWYDYSFLLHMISLVLWTRSRDFHGFAD